MRAFHPLQGVLFPALHAVACVKRSMSFNNLILLHTGHAFKCVDVLSSTQAKVILIKYNHTQNYKSN